MSNLGKLLKQFVEGLTGIDKKHHYEVVDLYREQIRRLERDNDKLEEERDEYKNKLHKLVGLIERTDEAVKNYKNQMPRRLSPQHLVNEVSKRKRQEYWKTKADAIEEIS